MKTLLIMATVLALSGCARFVLSDTATPIIAPQPITLTSESIMTAPDGSRIVVHYPKNVDKPVVVFDDLTGQWVASAKVAAPR